MRTAYEKLFGEALEEYNKGKRPDRRIKNYYEHIKKSKREELFYSAIVTFGDRNTAACGTPNGELTKQMLGRYMKEFQKRNPNLYVFNAVMHLDESEPHLHIKFIPFIKAADGEKCNSLRTRVSMKAALIAEGFIPSNPTQNQQTLFCNHERDNVMTEILQRHGLIRTIKGEKNIHRPTEQYRVWASGKEIAEQRSSLNSLPKIEDSERRMKDFEHSEMILKRENKKLKEKLESKLQPFYYSSEDKLQFIKSELDRLNIPYSETANGFEAPQWTADNIRQIEKSYDKSEKNQPDRWRERLTNDIDLLLLRAKDFEELLDLLRKSNWEIKAGKYISAKHKYGVRPIRLKSLGEFYSEQALRNRIETRNRYERQNSEKIKNATGFSLITYKTISQYILVYSAGRLPMRKSKRPKKPEPYYTFVNDENIQKLVELNNFINDNNLNGDNFKSKIENTEKNIAEIENLISRLNNKAEIFADLKTKAAFYFGWKQKGSPKVGSMEQSKLLSAKETLDEYGIKSSQDVSLEELIEEINIELKTRSDELETSREELFKLGELEEIYKEVNGGTFVQRLVKEEQERQKTELREKGIQV